MEASSITPKSLSLPWKPRTLLWAFSKVIDLVIRKDGTINRRLLNLIDFRIPPSPKPINGVMTYDVVVDPTRKLWFRVFVPIQHEKEDLPVIVFFHGGGYALLAPDVWGYDDVCRRFARELPAIVISVDYRLAPEHKHPAQLNDGFDVLKFLDNQENRSKWLPKNANISRCFIAGDSAGGNLAHHVAQTACEFNFQQLKVIGLVAIQPFFGGQERTNSEIELEGTPIVSMKRTDWFWNAFMSLDEDHNRDHPIINVSGPNAVDISKIDLPETIVFVAGFDALLDWQIRYYNWLKKSGREAYLVQYPNMCHGFYIFPQLHESIQYISDIREFIHKVLNKVCIGPTLQGGGQPGGHA